VVDFACTLHQLTVLIAAAWSTGHNQACLLEVHYVRVYLHLAHSEGSRVVLNSITARLCACCDSVFLLIGSVHAV
jgi:hypothetical protein